MGEVQRQRVALLCSEQPPCPPVQHAGPQNVLAAVSADNPEALWKRRGLVGLRRRVWTRRVQLGSASPQFQYRSHEGVSDIDARFAVATPPAGKREHLGHVDMLLTRTPTPHKLIAAMDASDIYSVLRPLRVEHKAVLRLALVVFNPRERPACSLMESERKCVTLSTDECPHSAVIEHANRHSVEGVTSAAFQ